MNVFLLKACLNILMTIRFLIDNSKGIAVLLIMQ